MSAILERLQLESNAADPFSLLARLGETLVPPAHDTVFVLQQSKTSFFGLSPDQWTQVFVSLLPVMALLAWEIWGRRWRDRKPIAAVLYTEVLGNYRALQGHVYEEYSSVEELEQVLPRLPDLSLDYLAFDTLSPKLDSLPWDTAPIIVSLYVDFKRLPQLLITTRERAIRRPEELATGGAVGFYVLIHEAMRKASLVLVRLHRVVKLEDDLRLVLRNPSSTSGSMETEYEARMEEQFVTRFPRIIQKQVRLVRRRWIRRRLWKTLWNG